MKQELREEVAFKAFFYSTPMGCMSDWEDMPRKGKKEWLRTADEILSMIEPLIRKDERERIAIEVELINDTAISTTMYRVMLERLAKSLKEEK